MSNPQIATLEEVKKVALGLIPPSNILLIDVREATELQEAGVIPNSINIPLDEIEKAFTEYSADKFKVYFGGVAKPNKNDPIIVSCRSGRRSLIAQEKLISLGYTNVKNYAGGWLEFSKIIAHLEG